MITTLFMRTTIIIALLVKMHYLWELQPWPQSS